MASRANQCWPYSGMDNPKLCKDSQHFTSYPHQVEYRYNSRGYRDQEWPDSFHELQNSIWCVGDSFTVGLGSPVSHTWPWLLQQFTQKRTINVSMDGASNFWMHRKCLELCQQIKPKIIVIHWSYITRSEIADDNLNDEQRRLHYSRELLDTTVAIHNFKKQVFDLETNKGHTKIIHSFIPAFAMSGTLKDCWNKMSGPDWPAYPNTLEQFDNLPAFVSNELTQDFECYEIFRNMCEICQNIQHVPEFSILDLARDGHHYDLTTAKHFVRQILELL